MIIVKLYIFSNLLGGHCFWLELSETFLQVHMHIFVLLLFCVVKVYSHPSPVFPPPLPLFPGRSITTLEDIDE